MICECSSSSLRMRASVLPSTFSCAARTQNRPRPRARSQIFILVQDSVNDHGAGLRFSIPAPAGVAGTRALAKAGQMPSRGDGRHNTARTDAAGKTGVPSQRARRAWTVNSNKAWAGDKLRRPPPMVGLPASRCPCGTRSPRTSAPGNQAGSGKPHRQNRGRSSKPVTPRQHDDYGAAVSGRSGPGPRVVMLNVTVASPGIDCRGPEVTATGPIRHAARKPEILQRPTWANSIPQAATLADPSALAAVPGIDTRLANCTPQDQDARCLTRSGAATRGRRRGIR
jgi:hypothetical protein